MQIELGLEQHEVAKIEDDEALRTNWNSFHECRGVVKYQKAASIYTLIFIARIGYQGNALPLFGHSLSCICLISEVQLSRSLQITSKKLSRKKMKPDE